MNYKASHSRFSFELITTICGISGAIFLSEGNNLAAQCFFCLSNPLLAITSWVSGAKTTAFLFLLYWIFSIRGVLLCLGAV
jgi:cellobiose-specific phosphotransferase system component IIC